MNIRKVAGFALGPLVAAGLGVLILPLMAWYFTAEDLGRNNFYTIFLSLSLTLFSLGQDQAFVREYHESKDKYALFKTCMVFPVLFFVIFLIVSLFFYRDFSRALYEKTSLLFCVLTLISAGANLFVRFFLLILRLSERGVAFSVNQILMKLVFVVVVGGAWLLEVRGGFSILLLTNSLALVLAVCLAGWNIRSFLWSAIFAKIDFLLMRRLLSFGLPLIGSSLAYWGLTSVSVVMLRSFSSLENVGVYALTASFAAVAVIFQSIFSTIWMPTAYKLLSEKKEPAVVMAVADKVVAFVALIVVMVGVLSWSVGYLVPPAYGDIKFLLACAMLQPLLYAASEATVVGLNVARRSGVLFGIAVVSFVVNLVLSYFLVPDYGVTGAVLSNAFSFFVFFVLRTELSARLWYKYPRRKIYLVTLFVVTLAVFVACIKDGWFVGASNVLWICSAGFLCWIYFKDLKGVYCKLKGKLFFS